MGLEPSPDGHSFPEDPFGIVIKNFNSINSRVLNEVKIRKNIPLLNSCFNKSKKGLNKLKRQLLIVILIRKKLSNPLKMS